jgi:hypothetical protein
VEVVHAVAVVVVENAGSRVLVGCGHVYGLLNSYSCCSKTIVDMGTTALKHLPMVGCGVSAVSFSFMKTKRYLLSLAW